MKHVLYLQAVFGTCVSEGNKKSSNLETPDDCDNKGSVPTPKRQLNDLFMKL